MIPYIENGNVLDAGGGGLVKYLYHKNGLTGTTTSDTNYKTSDIYFYPGSGVGSLIIVQNSMSATAWGNGGQDLSNTMYAQIVCVSGPTSGVMPSVSVNESWKYSDRYNYGNRAATFTHVISGEWLETNNLDFATPFSIILQVKQTETNNNATGYSRSWFIYGV